MPRPWSMNKKKRQLIFFWTYLEWGGAQIYFIAIMKAAKADWDVIVILPQGSSSELLGFLDQAGIRYEFIDTQLDMAPATTFRRKVERQLSRVRAELASLKYLKRFDLPNSILHIETAPWQSWVFLTLLSMRGANVFVTLHNALPRFPAWREFVWRTRLRFLSRRRGFHIFTSNRDTKDKFRGWVDDRFWDTIKVTYTCVDPPEIERALASSRDVNPIREENGIATDKFVVLCVGQFIDRKGRWVFLDAARIVSETDTDVQFVWLTPKMPNESDLARISDYGLSDTFKLILSETVGSKREAILRFFRVADVFALPSYVEGLPIALLEAMAMGSACISTNINAIPEAITHLSTGILIEPGDAAELARRILQLKTDDALRQKLARDGQRSALGNFDERVASQIAIDAYEECFTDGR